MFKSFPLTVINGVVTLISRLITAVTHILSAFCIGYTGIYNQRLPKLTLPGHSHFPSPSDWRALSIYQLVTDSWFVRKIMGIHGTGIFTYIYHILPLKTTKCRHKYSIHGWYRKNMVFFRVFFLKPCKWSDETGQIMRCSSYWGLFVGPLSWICFRWIFCGRLYHAKSPFSVAFVGSLQQPSILYLLHCVVL